MKKQILSEISRVRQIMGLHEQFITKEKIGEDKVDVVVDVPPIKGTYTPASSDPTSFIGESVTTIMTAIDNTQKAAEKLAEGKLQLVDINVKAGASNVWDSDDGATNYDVDNNYEPTTEGEDQTLDSAGYGKNVTLAEERANTYIEMVIPLLDTAGLNISEQISKTPDTVVVNTGGELDRDRDENIYPNPGQVLILTLSFMYTDVIEQFKETCEPGIEITIAVQGVGVDEHECDEAIFKVSVNGAKIGIANLNNGVLDRYIDGGGWNKMKSIWPKEQLGALQGTFQENWYRNLPGRNSPGRETDKVQGGKRSWTTMIDTEDEKFNWGEENILENTPLVFNKGKNSYVEIKGGTDVQLCGPQAGFRPCGSHSEVPKVTIKNTPVEGQLTTVYDTQPNIGKLTFGSTDTTELLRMDDCGVPIEVVEVSPN